MLPNEVQLEGLASRVHPLGRLPNLILAGLHASKSEPLLTGMDWILKMSELPL